MPKEMIADLQKVLFKRFNLLVVDDEEWLRVMLRERFEGLPYFKVITASSVDEAVDIIESKSIDPLNFLITDLHMPMKSGIDLLKRYEKSHGFKVAFSGKANCEMGGLAVELGALRCIHREGSGTLDRLMHLICSYLPISFCSKGKIGREMLEIFEKVHKQKLFGVSRWAACADLGVRTLENKVNAHIDLSPRDFIHLSYGLYYLLAQSPECKPLESLLTPITSIDIARQCLVSLNKYCLKNDFPNALNGPVQPQAN